MLAPVPNAADKRPGESMAAPRFAQQDKAAIRRDQAAVEGGDHLLVLNGWKIEGETAIVGHGEHGAFVVQEQRRFDNESLSDANSLRHVRHPKCRPAVNNPDKWQRQLPGCSRVRNWKLEEISEWNNETR